MSRPSRPSRLTMFAIALMLWLPATPDAAARTPSPKACLAHAASGGAPLPEIVYSDAHGLWGGTTITLGADGAYRRDRVEPGQPPERAEFMVDTERHRALVRLLIELKAWKQRVPVRRAVPDESKAFLRIRCGDAEAGIWEWYNALGEGRRIVRVRDALWALEAPAPASAP